MTASCPRQSPGVQVGNVRHRIRLQVGPDVFNRIQFRGVRGWSANPARPFFGQAGFTLIAIAAMLSTASAINATLYGAARLRYCIARDGELPA